MKNGICKYIFIAAVSLFVSSASLHSQTGEKTKFYDPSKRFSVSLYGTYISSSELLNNPRSTDPIEREASIDLPGGYGYGAEFDYEPPLFDLDLIFYLSTEYFKSSSNELVLRLNNGEDKADVRVYESYSVMPVEAGIKWWLPVSTDNFKIYIGGGGGIYFGDRTRTILNLSSTNVDKKPGFNVNVLSGIEYYIARNLSANFEFKFREAVFDVESKYSTDVITVNGIQFALENPFYTRFVVDGVRLSAGLKYQF
jgi:hypothetical protein